jgi:hypothetical protein
MWTCLATPLRSTRLPKTQRSNVARLQLDVELGNASAASLKCSPALWSRRDVKERCAPVMDLRRARS